ncbi:Trehalose transport system permease protein SugA [Pseudovibrio sp. W64]|uniref:carbohydrate ABC transporter permease n=1 Tax=unclassified Pseudovibrio TaxID=2627060 RepID=UPI000708CD64|nr:MULTISPECIES: sugar ABC transporter permease [unclassified Pseudovibrio]KZK78237.1 Trehalose transport system permease protein SugA [Pseudovibrio sp. W64]KZK84625.1 Trehalose transport system permease protein SugA [Pseudovibrio sp. Ad13]KZK92906.1 Trehalose transport system permease protein SugA [Pseudovibrio sp. Ad5]KZK98677.1 Trehalose transport system permease protein SugA [Pseudovibrio sp. W74]KZL09169.1 Trehalose transport system permease protein SugA [Pseudovibrio sp. Ad14]
MNQSNTFWRVALLALPLSVFALIIIWPLLSSFYYGFTNWNGFSDNYDFVGFENFGKLFSDRLFMSAAINTIIWMAIAVVLPTILGLSLALLIDSHVPGGPIFKTIFYLPICLSAVVVGQVWVWIYQPDWGLLNSIIEYVTNDRFNYAWLAKPDSALYSVIVAWSWQATGLSMVIYLAGLTAIPGDLLEVCELEGATTWQRIRHVILPLLTPATVVVVALSVINSLKGFDILYIMTGGGPFNSSDTLAMHMYNESFKKYLMGYGSAISVVLFLVALTIIRLYFKQLKKVDEIYG